MLTVAGVHTRRFPAVCIKRTLWGRVRVRVRLARVSLLRELGAHQPFAFQMTGLAPESRYFISFEVRSGGARHARSGLMPLWFTESCAHARAFLQLPLCVLWHLAAVPVLAAFSPPRPTLPPAD